MVEIDVPKLLFRIVDKTSPAFSPMPDPGTFLIPRGRLLSVPTQRWVLARLWEAPYRVRTGRSAKAAVYWEGSASALDRDVWVAISPVYPITVISLWLKKK